MTNEEIKAMARCIAYEFCDVIGFHKEQFLTDKFIKVIEEALREASRVPAKVRDALEFYADRTSWGRTGKGLSITWFKEIHEDTEEWEENVRAHIGVKNILQRTISISV